MAEAHMEEDKWFLSYLSHTQTGAHTCFKGSWQVQAGFISRAPASLHGKCSGLREKETMKSKYPRADQLVFTSV